MRKNDYLRAKITGNDCIINCSKYILLAFQVISPRLMDKLLLAVALDKVSLICNACARSKFTPIPPKTAESLPYCANKCIPSSSHLLHSLSRPYLHFSAIAYQQTDAIDVSIAVCLLLESAQFSMPTTPIEHEICCFFLWAFNDTMYRFW